MQPWAKSVSLVGLAVPLSLSADTRTISVDAMPTAVFVGDSQTTGRNLAIDYPQLLSRVLPVRVINTSVGGSNSDALLKPMSGGVARVAKGEHVLYGTDVSWGMGPYPGMRVTVDGEVYTIDSVVEHPPTRNAELHLVESARADYEGTAYSIEPGWEVRVARYRPSVVCLMFINDGTMPTARLENWREMIHRIRAMGAVPVLMSPFPVDDSARGGNHPGDNTKVAQNAAAVQALATAEKTWFVDVFSLALALDPPLRCQIHDGIHPDTDGQTVVIDALLWVFEQMGLKQARPFIRGWHLIAPPGTLPDTSSSEVRPFRTSQPDHPEPDLQSEKGFSLAAIRRNDEYGLLAAVDGEGVPVGQGVLLSLGLEADALPRRLVLRLAGEALLPPQVWDASAATWQRLETSVDTVRTGTEVPLNALQQQRLHVLVTSSPGGMLDAVSLCVEEAAPLAAFLPSSMYPRFYVLESDHTRPGNLVRNADFEDGVEGVVNHWRLSDGLAAANRPFRVRLETVSFGSDGDLLHAMVTTRVPVRPYDLLMVSGSQVGNDGSYRIREVLGDGRYQLRRRAKALESGLSGELVHDDGCGLVAGGCCVEVRPDGQAETTVDLPPGSAGLRLSLFARVIDPRALGTRDTPGEQSLARIVFRDRSGATLASPGRVILPPVSYQWRKLTVMIRVPRDAHKAVLTLSASGPGTVQYTGVYLAPIDR